MRLRDCFVPFAALWGLAMTAHGFIPPIGVVLKEGFSQRKANSFELKLRHHLSGKWDGEIQELISCDRSECLVIWNGSGIEAVSGKISDTGFILGAGNIPSRTQAALRALLSFNGDSYQNQLLRSGFLSRELFNQYKQGFEPQGDPRTWNIKDNYLVQPGTSLQRTEQGPAYEFEGRKGCAVWLDVSTRVTRKLIWSNGDATASWKFERVASESQWGPMAHRIESEGNGFGKVESDVVSFKANTSHSKFREVWKRTYTGNLSQQTEQILSRFLAYR